MRTICFFLLLCCVAVPAAGSEETKLAEWLDEYDKEAQALLYSHTVAHWNYNTNLTEHNGDLTITSDAKMSKFVQEKAKIAKKFNKSAISDEDLKRQLKKVSIVGIALNESQQNELSEVKNAMVNNYGSGSICAVNLETMERDCTKKYSLTELTKIMASSRNYEELKYIWKGWRDVAGRPIRDNYHEYVRLSNIGANIGGFEDTADYWRSDFEDPNFQADIARLWQQVLPLYEQLHTYVRTHLMKEYPGKFQSAAVPAHILGNMWGQAWVNLYNSTAPYPHKPTIDAAGEMEKQGYSPVKLFEIADNLFKSLGLMGVPDAFWEDSMLVKPEGRSVVCHASAWDFHNTKDFRIKMCTQIDMVNWYVVHHEMGHIQYFMQYANKPTVFQQGANQGFHEGVADTLALSASTPSYLKGLGLLSDYKPDPQQDINYLYRQALKIIAFLPFGYLVDLWRWKVFDGTYNKSYWNQGWWDLRYKYQGLVPPVTRSSMDFDPGAKYHVPADAQYVIYFVAHMLEFQFYKALCEAAGSKVPLYQCDLYGSKEAGEKFAAMLKLGSSKHWKEAMQEITGQKNVSALPMMEYFRPLMQWLEEKNRGQCFGWGYEWPSHYVLPQPRCGVEIMSSSSASSSLAAAAVVLNVVCVVIVVLLLLGGIFLIWLKRADAAEKA